MFSHIVIGSNGFERSRAFYRGVLEPLGVELIHDGAADGCGSAGRACHRAE